MKICGFRFNKARSQKEAVTGQSNPTYTVKAPASQPLHVEIGFTKQSQTGSEYAHPDNRRTTDISINQEEIAMGDNKVSTTF